MNRTGLPILVFVLAFSTSCGFLMQKHHSPACKQRGAALGARVEKLKRDAHEVLKLGAPKEIVTKFFEENGLPVSFTEKEATGTITVQGCSPTGCGSDDAWLGLRVDVDIFGTVVGPPQVGSIYTNCL